MGSEFACKSKQPTPHKRFLPPKKKLSPFAPVHPVLQFQRIMGNQGVVRLQESQKIQRKCACGGTCPHCQDRSMKSQRDEIREILHGPRVQSKLTIGEPNDKYEQEADRVAEQVMRMPELQAQRQVGEESEKEILQTKNVPGPSPGLTPEIAATINAIRGGGASNTRHGGWLSRKATGGNMEAGPFFFPRLVQAKSKSNQPHAIGAKTHIKIQSLRGGGQPLSSSSRAFFEPRFGTDLSHVRIHKDQQAAQTARAINARAFATGNNIAFAPGEYSPDSHEGRYLLAHELTHTFQQDRPGGQPTMLRQVAEPDDQAGEAPLVGPCPAGPTPKILLRIGSIHPSVRKAQQQLNTYNAIELEAGRPGLAGGFLVEDCIFGPKTRTAVVNFQAQAFPDDPAEWDAIIGPKTWAMLDLAALGLLPIRQCVSVLFDQAIGNAPESRQALFEDSLFDDPPQVSALNVGGANFNVVGLGCGGGTQPRPPNRFTNCKSVVVGIEKAETNAMGDVLPNALRKLSSHKGSKDADVDNALFLMFRDQSARRVKEVEGTLKDTLDSIKKLRDHICVPTCTGGDAPPKTKVLAKADRSKGRIFICLDGWKTLKKHERTRYIIHEHVHLASLKADHCRYFTTADCKETPSTVICPTGLREDTTDAYSCFAMRLKFSSNLATEVKERKAQEPLLKGKGLHIEKFPDTGNNVVDLSLISPIFSMLPIPTINPFFYRWELQVPDGSGGILTLDLVNLAGNPATSFDQDNQSAQIPQQVRDQLKQNNVKSGEIVADVKNLLGATTKQDKFGVIFV